MPKRPYLVSVEGGVAVLITIVVAVVKKMGWELRSSLILIGIIVIIDLARRIPQRTAMRVLIGGGGIAILLMFSWQSVVDDFQHDPGIMEVFGFKASPLAAVTSPAPSGAAPGTTPLIGVMPGGSMEELSIKNSGVYGMPLLNNQGAIKKMEIDHSKFSK